VRTDRRETKTDATFSTACPSRRGKFAGEPRNERAVLRVARLLRFTDAGQLIAETTLPTCGQFSSRPSLFSRAEYGLSTVPLSSSLLLFPCHFQPVQPHCSRLAVAVTRAPGANHFAPVDRRYRASVTFIPGARDAKKPRFLERRHFAFAVALFKAGRFSAEAGKPRL